MPPVSCPFAGKFFFTIEVQFRDVALGGNSRILNKWNYAVKQDQGQVRTRGEMKGVGEISLSLNARQALKCMLRNIPNEGISSIT